MSISFKVSIVLKVDKTNVFLFQESERKMLMTNVVCNGVHILLPNQMHSRMSNSKSYFFQAVLWSKGYCQFKKNKNKKQAFWYVPPQISVGNTSTLGR